MSGTPDLHLAFDVGHSSIGWAVLKAANGQAPELLGCGSVIFPADDCLASQRRGFRRQRRHIRATRQRIARMKTLIEHLGTLTREQLDANDRAWPWLLAARVLAGGTPLTWPELWDVLRWYAHNRGYDGNKRWSEAEAAAKAEDTEKVNNARELYKKFGTSTMAATFCAVCGLDPLGSKRSCALAGDKRPKALNAAFPREDVEAEVRAILERQAGFLPKVDSAFIRALFEDWKAIPYDGLKLPLRFSGGLLFGQIVPRFENRIVARCPVTFERIFRERLAETNDRGWAKKIADKLAKVPSKECREFYEYRWAMQLANVMISGSNGKAERLIKNESWRRSVDAKMRERGFLTPGEFKKVVRELTGGAADNLGQMLLHPDAQKALLLDPVKKLITGDSLVATLWPLLPERLQKRAMGKWRRGKMLSVGELIADIPDEERSEIKMAIQKCLDGENTKKRNRAETVTHDEFVGVQLRVEQLDGRAPYHRDVLRNAVADVMDRGIHPTEEGGCLFRSEAIRNAQLQRAIDEQTNNHLVRHRLLILDRLHRDILKEYASGDKSRVERVTIEVNRDLREMSGKTAKEVKQDLGQRLANFNSVSDRLKRAFAGKDLRITPGLIRKARVAEDLGWRCPYTGKGFDEFDLLYRKVDKDHVIPRSQRPSDSLDSLVITFNEVNRLKGKRTALRFIEDEQGKAVEGMPNLTMKTLAGYIKDVEALESFKGHDDDKRRKRNRKRMMLVRDFVEKEFIPADLTQTSQLVRLGAQGLQKEYLGASKKPVITSLPGSVTGAVRKCWDLLGCLSAANSQVLDPVTGEVRTKTEIREITHMHHALDACVLAFASLFLPGRGRDGEGWKLLVKRRLNADEQARAHELFKDYIKFEKDGTSHLIDLPRPFKDQIRRCIAERRVAQHIPAQMSGLPAQLNAWGVERIQEGRVWLHQSIRQPDGSRKKNLKDVDLNKVIGLSPEEGNGKLKAIRGALILDQNYGIAILEKAEGLPSPKGKSKSRAASPVVEIVPYHKVWHRLETLKKTNKDCMPRILRSGQSIHVPRGTHTGFWRIFSVKNNADGLAVALGDIDALHHRNDKQNVRILTLLRDGLRIVGSSLCGIDAGVSDLITGMPPLPVEKPEGSSRQS